MEKMKQSLENRKQRDAAALEKMKLRITVQEETRDVDPRIYYEWGKQVAYDWKQYYPKSLHNKFSWLDCQDDKKEEN